MRKLVWLSSVISLFVVLVSGSFVRAAELRKFVMGYSTVGAMAAGMWMAKEIGDYEKYGIDAKWK